MTRLSLFAARLLGALLSLAAWLVPAAARAEAEVRRYALLVGANDGGAPRVKLRYASTDAESFATVLEQLGGVPSSRRVILKDPTPATLKAGFEELAKAIERDKPSALRSEFLLYYSGHSDEEGLLLGGVRVEYPTLRAMVDALPADVKLAVLDSCSSGAITRQKGGVHRPPFLVDESVQVRGHAFLTSSSADEAAQESDRLAASFFTHYLVSGMRGAADANTDGKITLNEVYQFAYSETLARTQKTAAGPQHPAYDIDLVGTGDIVLTDLRATSARLVLDAELSGRVFVKSTDGKVSVELQKSAGQAVELGLAPGEYQITLSQKKTYSTTITLSKGTPVSLGMSGLSEASTEKTRTRGDAAPEDNAARPYAVPPLAIACCGWWRGQPDSFGVGISSRAYGLRGIDIEAAISSAGGEVYGLQVAGGLVLARQDVTGIQIAGGVAYAGGSLEGLQVAGGVSANRGGLQGLQIAGGMNLAGVGEKREFDPYASLATANLNPGRGLQVGGFGNLTGAHEGGQIAGMLNVTAGPLRGIQIAGGSNIARGELSGLQIAGGMNLATGKARGLQIAGGMNLAGGSSERPFVVQEGEAGASNGVQIAVLNVAGNLEGAQIGVVNIARDVRGAQIGVVNIARSIEGAPVGILSLVKEGQHNLALYTNDINPINASFQAGGRSVYTLFSAGLNPAEGKTLTSFGLALGLHRDLGKRLYGEADLGTSNFLLFDSTTSTARMLSSQLYSLRANVGYSLAEHLSLFGGLSLHALLNYNGNTLDLGGLAQDFSLSDAAALRVFPGFSLGLKL